MNYWKISAGKGGYAIDDFIEKKIVALGVIKSDRAHNIKSAEEMRALVSVEHPNAPNGRINAWGSQLFRFYNEVAKGDRVLVYNNSTRNYHLGEIVSDVEYTEKSDFNHTRKVNWLKVVSRDNLSVSTKNSLGSISSLFKVSDEATSEIENYMQGSNVDTIGHHSTDANQGVGEIGEDVHEQSQEFIKDYIVNKLDWSAMQDLVAGLLRAMGYMTKVSGAGSDRGRDIIASPDGLGLEDPRIVVEVKHRPKEAIGAPDIRAFITGLRNSRGGLSQILCK